MKLLPWLFQSSDLNPTENEWGELKRRSTNIELWIWRIWRYSIRRNGLWSPFSKLIRHYRRKLRAVILGKGRFNNWLPILWPTWSRESIYFTIRFPSPTHTFNCFTSIIGWHFVNFNRIHNADLFSQPPFLIFTKADNISGGHSVQLF